MTRQIDLGQKAARDGMPYTANPHPKPASPNKLIEGETYPGNWCLWLSGWIDEARRMGIDDMPAVIARYDFIQSGIGYHGPPIERKAP